MKKGERVLYQMIEGFFQLEGLGEYHSYGVQLPNGFRFDDVTIDANALGQFVKRLNHLGISELHWRDIVLDFIG